MMKTEVMTMGECSKPFLLHPVFAIFTYNILLALQEPLIARQSREFDGKQVVQLHKSSVK